MNKEREMKAHLQQLLQILEPESDEEQLARATIDGTASEEFFENLLVGIIGTAVTNTNPPRRKAVKARINVGHPSRATSQQDRFYIN